MMRNPAQMTDEEIVGEVKALAGELTKTSARIMELGRNLHERGVKLRRASAGSEVSRALVLFANAWVRYAGMVTLGARRTGTVERVLIAAKERALEDTRQEQFRQVSQERSRVREAARMDAKFARSAGSIDDLVELYGESVGNDAR